MRPARPRASPVSTAALRRPRSGRVARARRQTRAKLEDRATAAGVPRLRRCEPRPRCPCRSPWWPALVELRRRASSRALLPRALPWQTLLPRAMLLRAMLLRALCPTALQWRGQLLETPSALRWEVVAAPGGHSAVADVHWARPGARSGAEDPGGARVELAPAGTRK